MRTLFSLVAFFALVLAGTPSLAAKDGAHAASPRFLVHLLSYIKQDYPGAVKDGKITSDLEYNEQVEFTESAIQASAELPQVSADADIARDLGKLKRLVKEKADGALVAQTAQALETRVIQLTGLEVAPLRWPDLATGKRLFASNCAQCHGATGHGDGPSGSGLDPKPSDFHDAKRDGTSPFQAFNAIRLGVPGTGMASFSTLTEAEAWSLAFYVVSLRHEKSAAAALDVPTASAQAIDLKTAASHSDEALRAKLSAASPSDRDAIVARVRLRSERQDDMRAFLPVARDGLREAMALVERGDWAGAKHAAVVAYLEGLEPVEPRLRARDSSFTIALEEKMAGVRAAIEARQPRETIEARVAEADKALVEAEAMLAEGTASPRVTFAIAAGIFLREAFEAVLVLVTLLGVIRGLGSRKAAAYVHAGWMTAVGVGLVAWFFSGWVMRLSGANRELLEGTISLVAVAVLLYFGFWLHRRTEIGRWRAFINEMVKTAVEGKSLYVLGVASFMAVFREAFETVLFLRALLVEAGPAHELAVGAGVLVAFLCVLALAALLIRGSRRIPVRQLFALSSLVMVGLALILVGKAMHAFQETGLLTITTLPLGLRSDLIGLYPTYETLIPQLAVLGVSTVIWIYGRRLRLGEAS